jgi:hypothetical protein
MVANIEALLDVAQRVDELINNPLLSHVTVEEGAAGAGEVTIGSGEDACHIDGQDMTTFRDPADATDFRGAVDDYGAGEYARTASGGWVNLGSVKGTMAVGLDQMTADSLNQSGATVIEQSKAANAAIQRSIKA